MKVNEFNENETRVIPTNVLLFKRNYYHIAIPELSLVTYYYEDINELLYDRYNLKEYLEIGRIDNTFGHHHFFHVSEKEINEIKDKQIYEIPYDVFFSEGLEKEFPELFV